MNLHLGIHTLPSLLPQASTFFRILTMFCRDRAAAAATPEPHLLPGETVTGISLLCLSPQWEPLTPYAGIRSPWHSEPSISHSISR